MERKDPIVVLNVDYDGCSDILVPHVAASKIEVGSAAEGRLSEYRNFAYDYFKLLAANADGVVLMVGSNRQDYGTDAVNAYLHGTGYATNNFKHIKADLEESIGRDVELYKLLRADGNRAAGTEWDTIEAGRYTQSAEDIYQNLRNPNWPPGWIPRYTEAPRTDLKVDLLTWQIQRLQEKFGPDKLIHIHFCDDRLDILEALTRMKLMANVKLTLIHMNYYTYVFKGEGSAQDTVVPLASEVPKEMTGVFQDAKL